MAKLLFTILLMTSMGAFAEGPIYQPADMIPLGCTNPDARTNGDALAPEEISSIVIYISSIADKALLPSDPADFLPEHIEIMEGGCTNRQAAAANLTPGTQYYKYGVTYDIGDLANNIPERVSDYTEPSSPFYTDLAKPNPPSIPNVPMVP